MKKNFTILTLLLLIAGQIFAIPAKPTPVIFTQPDCKRLTVLMRGDERIHWSETLDGYTLLYNNKGYLTYAQLDEYGNLIPSDFIATDVEKRNFAVVAFLNTIEKKLWFGEAQKQMMLEVWQIEDEARALHHSRGTNGVIGEYKTLCAFVQFPNKSFIKTMSQFDPLFNQLGYTGNGTGSVRDFFKEASYEQFDLEITLCGIYTAPQNENYYAGNDGTQNCPILARWLAQQVAAEPDINFADYDSDNNGWVDGFHFVFAGLGQEAGGGYGSIWSHKWQFSPSVCQNGKCIEVYSCSPELISVPSSSICTIGVICHEMTHAFGSADYYDTNGGTGGNYIGTGSWDLMADGSWNPYNGNCPAHQNMYVKIQFGWVTPILLSAPLVVTDMPNSTYNPVAYRINTGNGNEHYLLENMQRVGFNAAVPGNGLLIYHAHNNVGSNCINCTHPQKMYPVCASSSTAIPAGGPGGYGSINSGGCPFPGNSNKTAFTGTSTPTMFYWTNTPVNKPLTEITQNNSNQTVSFKFMDGAAVQYTVTVSAYPSYGGTVSQSGNGTYNLGSSVTVTATPNTGYSFSNWTENGAEVCSEESYTFDIEDDRTLVANFKNSNANLTSLTVTPGVLNPQFSPDITDYDVNVDYQVETVTIKGVAQNNYATVTGNVTDSPIDVGENDFTITVTAQDDSTKDYNVKVIRAESNIAIADYQTSIVKIYPNPASNCVNIESENIISEIIIFDATGKKIQEITNIGEKVYQLDVKSYVNNIYYLKVDGTSLKLVVTD